MPGVAASILATLGLDKTHFSAGLRAAETEAQSFAGSLRSGLSAVSGIGMLGAGLSFAGIGAAAKEIVDYAAKVQHLSDRYGVSTDAIQRFGNAAEENGSSMDAVAKALGRMEVARAKALQGNNELQDSFSRLDVSMTDLRKLSPEEIMDKLAKSSLNAADMVKLLGRNAMELRAILHGIGTGQIDKGAVIDAKQIAELEKADKAWKHFGEGWRKFGAELITGTPEVAKGFAADVGAYFGKFGDVFTGKSGANFSTRVGNLFGALGDFISPDPSRRLVKLENLAPTGKTAGKKSALPEEDEIGDAIEAMKEHAKLSLAELAGRSAYGEENVYRGKYIGGDITKAQAALREKQLAEDASFAGRDQEARLHLTKFQQMTGGIGSLRESDKGFSPLERAFKPTETKLDAIQKNTEKQFVNH